MKKKFITVTVTIFILMSIILYAMKIYAPRYHFTVLEAGNAIMAALTLSAYFIVKKQIEGKPQAFVRGVMGASFLKLMVCMVSVLVYVLLNRAEIDMATIFMLFGIYIVYTAAERVLLSKLARE